MQPSGQVSSFRTKSPEKVSRFLTEFIKECLLDSVALICPEKRGAFENVSLSRCTVTRRVETIAGNLELQLKNRVADFDCFTLALDESTAQLLIFLRGITADFQITEELAAMQSIKGTTTGNDLYKEVNACLDMLGLKWDKLAGVTTDGCPNLTGKNVGRLKRMQDKENESEHVDISYHSNVRWLSLGKVLKSVWDLRDQIQNFCGKKGHDIPELSDEDWVADLRFAVDVTALMNELNVRLQRKGFFVHEMYSAVTAFMSNNKPSEGQHSDPLANTKGSHKISRSPPQVLNVDNAPSDVQMELIDLQSHLLLAEHFRSVSLLDFYSSLKEENFPHLRRHAQRILVLFGSTYVCEQTFFVMKFNKSKHRSSITDEHLSAVLCIATSDSQISMPLFKPRTYWIIRTEEVKWRWKT
ncbi:general transcription factor II-I repeat domain-containing protein 2-like [Solea senegalensis]|uniref:General transcription factor II-I repeat domain-containing protein 2-like n=1 Tax=Solea senegalensis TaxID=28829 RepID=A0AAV6SJ94_SOLSE|nr:general transcription factor II-I repeat domain-containing protein 2-like [Solea senegalensis]